MRNIFNDQIYDRPDVSFGDDCAHTRQAPRKSGIAGRKRNHAALFPLTAGDAPPRSIRRGPLVCSRTISAGGVHEGRAVL